MAAGTAAALVPIKSITRNSTVETSQYIAEDSEEPGPVCLKLISTLQGIQRGKLEDTFGWTVKVSQVDETKYAIKSGEVTNGTSGRNVDKLP